MADVPANWTEHTHKDGRRYYYNKVTNTSSWDKPQCLKSDQEKANTTSWKEYKTAEGRDYYFNPVTKQSVWEMPIELKRLRGLAAAEQEEESDEEEEEQEQEEEEWKTQEERKNAFQAVLTEKGVKSTMKWEEALKLIQDDRRFNALSSAGERKQEFSIWVTKTKKREKEEERENKKRAKDDFVKALSEWKDLKVSARYKDAAEAFHEEEWWKLLEEDDRDEVFQDFMEEHEKKTKEERRKQRKEYVEKVKKIYEDHEKISVTSKWREVQDSLRDNETFRWLSKLEALTSWEEWITETEKRLIQEKTTAQYRHARKLRDNFRALLKEHFDAGKFKSDSHWDDYIRDVKMTEQPQYLALIGVGGSTPHDLYDDFLENLENIYKEDRNKVKKMAKAQNLTVTSSSTFEWFDTSLSKEDGYKEIPETTRKQAFESMLEKAKEQDEAQEKAAKKARKKFVELLQKTREVSAKTTYEQAEKLLKSNSAWEACDEETRKQCFSIFVDQLKIQTKNKDDDDDSEGDDDSEQPSEPVKKKSKKVEKEKEKEKEKGKKRKDDDSSSVVEAKKPKKHKKK